MMGPPPHNGKVKPPSFPPAESLGTAHEEYTSDSRRQYVCQRHECLMQRLKRIGKIGHTKPPAASHFIVTSRISDREEIEDSYE
tara:strand:+ start:1021 stop:1272 length:252 start_codon:yes stop_codon:yes gene_type:complete